ncbi:hypothetical protein BC831DRAFT_441572 [Entophlyctis helioformis]|nr:hypothetical protein BC831DRAFT_441572 [Entophlyctis helioformis]
MDTATAVGGLAGSPRASPRAASAARAASPARAKTLPGVRVGRRSSTGTGTNPANNRAASLARAPTPTSLLASASSPRHASAGMLLPSPSRMSPASAVLSARSPSAPQDPNSPPQPHEATDAAPSATDRWRAAFLAHAATVPYHVLPQYVSNLAGTATAIVALPSHDASRVQVSAASGTVSYPYQIALSRIENLPLPRCVSDAYLAAASNAQQTDLGNAAQLQPLLVLELRATLFDTESGRFFGKTWSAQSPIDLLQSSRSLRSAVSKSKSAARAAAQSDKRSRSSKHHRASLPKQKPSPTITDGAALLGTDDGGDDHSSNDSAETSGSDNDGHDNDSHNSDSSSSTSDQSVQDEDHRVAAASLYGHRVSLNASKECIYFHSSVNSPYVVVALEFVYLVNNSALAATKGHHDASAQLLDRQHASHDNTGASAATSRVSGGWTLLYPFNPSKNGINVAKVWRDDDPDSDSHDSDQSLEDGQRESRRTRRGRAHDDDGDMDDEPKLTPRILPFVHSQLFPALSGYPGLMPLAGAILAYRILARPDVRPVCQFWKENTFIAPGDKVPGIASISVRQIVPQPSETARLSQIRLAVYPSIEKFESKFLERIAKVQFDSEPDSLTPDSHGHLPQPSVLERRLHIGFHNGRAFLGPPTIITLNPHSRSTADNELLVFKGAVELDNYVPGNEEISIVFLMEYKVQLTVNVRATKKRTGLAAILEKLSPADSKPAEPMQPTETIEKFVVTGWSAWVPPSDDPALAPSMQDQSLVLETIAAGGRGNPLGSLVYSPKNVSYSADAHHPNHMDGQDGNNPLASWHRLDERNLTPLTLSFAFNTPDRPPSAAPAPPLLVPPPRPTSPIIPLQKTPDVVTPVPPSPVVPEPTPEPKVLPEPVPVPAPIPIEKAPAPVPEPEPAPQPVIETPPPRPVEQVAPLPPPQVPEDNEDDREDELHAVQPSPTFTTAAEEFMPFPLPQPPSLRPQLSRMERARLLNAGFEMLSDEDGQRPTQVMALVNDAQMSQHSQPKFDMDAEIRDLRANDVSLQFQGLTFSQDLFHQLGDRFPQSVYFSFQFYTFPHTTSERLAVYTGPLPAKQANQRAQQGPAHGRQSSQSAYSQQPPSPHHRSASVPMHSRQWSHVSHASQRSMYASVEQHGSGSCGGTNTSPPAWPGILYRFDRDGFPAYEQPPGLSINYLVDPRAEPPSQSMRSGPNAFPFYMARTHLFIDVWDADSLLHVGSGCLDLKPAMRQDRSAVYFDDDVDILWSEMADDVAGGSSQSPLIRHSASVGSSMSTLGATCTSNASSNGDRYHSAHGHVPAASRPRPQHLKMATLHMRVTNIGRKQPANSLHTGVNLAKPDIVPSVIVHDYHHHIRHREPTFHESRRLPEIDAELGQVLADAYADRMARRRLEAPRDAAQETTQPKHRTREQKLIQHAAHILKSLELGPERLGMDSSDIADLPERFMYRLSREERERDLKTIDIFRERRRKDATLDMLRREMTTSHVIHPSFGQATYFEFHLTNPYHTDQTFRIAWHDQELRLVLDAAEWQFYRKLHGVSRHRSNAGHSATGGLESKLAYLGQGGVPEVYVEADETVAIPFVFQSFLGGRLALRGAADGVVGDEMMEYGGAMGGRSDAAMHDPAVIPRTIMISIIGNDDQPVAILSLSVSPRPYYVDRVIRLFRGEDELVRKVIRYPLGNSSKKSPVINRDGTAAVFDTSNPGQLYVRSNIADAVCTASATRTDAAFAEISFKYRVSPAPDTRAVYILFYNDPYHASLHEVWRVFVHSLYRFDMNCILGQTNAASLVLRGTSMSRPVMCYSSMPHEVTVASAGPFILTANALNEVILLARPNDTRTREAVMNIVDADAGVLVSSWMVVTHCSLPEVTKTFELLLPRHKLSSKRVSYTNPFFHRKILYLRTDSPHLLQFKESVLDLEPGGTQYIGLKFQPCQAIQPAHHGQAVEILVFLNDENDRMEECLAIKVHYEG